MPADLVTRLWLESKGFDRNIGRAIGYLSKLKKEAKDGGDQVDAFGRRMDSSIGNLGNILSARSGLLGKFAGGIGAIVTASAAFDKAINSNAQLQGKYNDLMKGGSMVVDQFFSSLYSGDWSVFNKGILKAIENAERFQKSYRNTMQMLETQSVEYERIDAEKNRLESIIEDDTRSLDERKKAQAELDRLLIMGIADIREASGIVNETLNNMITGMVGEGAKYVRSDNAQKLINQLYNPYSGLSKRVQEYGNIKDLVNNNINWNVAKYSGEDYYKMRSEAVDKYYKQYTADERAYLDELLRLQQSLNKDTYALYKETFDRINDLADKAGTWEKDRTGAKDEIISATGELKTNGTTTLKVDKIELPKIEVSALEGQLAGVTQLSIAKQANMYGGMNLDEMNSQLQAFRSTLPEGGIQLINTENHGPEDYLNGLASILTSINTLTAEGAAGWLQWSATVLGTIAQTLPQIAALTTKTAGLAVAQGVASAAATPVFGWLMAGAAAASIIAAIASAPKFATGGIVKGGQYVGDKVPIFANSGEMVLTTGQQEKLFRMISAGSYGGGNITISGELKGQGDALIATINNTNRKKSRMR